MKIKNFLLSAILFLTVFGSFAQNRVSALRINDNNRHANAYLDFSGVQQRLNEIIPFAYTAIALKSKNSLDFSEFSLIAENDTIPFYNEAHSPENSEFYYSTLIHFDKPQQSLDLIFPEGIEGIHLVLINSAGEGSEKKKDDNKKEERNYEALNNCELPTIVQQSEWRSGLSEPNYKRSFTTTRNMIVHHSAYPNSITNYRQAVRDIYILHTQENGWSDIGYNYLIAPDGMLYAGRDPADGEQDKVIGAHFCGSNSNTMGVCLLGNFQEQDATGSAYSTIEQLFAWKAFKDNLDPLTQNPHPLNSNLGVIAGHRDGCNTACPGEFVYNNLAGVRVEVAAKVSQCSEGEEDPEGPVVVFPDESSDTLISYVVYPNPVEPGFELNLVMNESSQETLKNLYLYDAFGKRIKWEGLRFQPHQITIILPKTISTGVYFLYVLKEEADFTRKFMIP